MPDYTDLRREIRDGIALLTLDRPEKLNLERRRPEWKLRVGRDWPDWPV